ncbi:MAG: enoyl-CoA hydratase/isomerase family protein [bacterium]
MLEYRGDTLSWSVEGHVVRVELHRAPANEIGSEMLDDLERLAGALPALEERARALVLYSSLPAGFCAGADLRELWRRAEALPASERVAGVREFLERIHAVLNRLDDSSLTTIAALHGMVFGGGFELALACDVLVADKLARFCFPELRLGLIPGFGGIPRLERDVGNAVVRDLLLTGRSLNAKRAHEVGLVSQLVGEGQALPAALATAAQTTKFDAGTATAAKRFAKPVPYERLAEEIDVFCELLARPAVEEGLRRFVNSADPLPYLP